MKKSIDFRSDTLTLPTEEMMRAIAAADLGDDVYGEDPSVNRLERFAAELIGKEDALLVTSGTMGNLTAALTHTQRRRAEIIAEADSHIVNSEGGNLAHFGGIAVRALQSADGALTPEQIDAAVRDPNNVHHALTSLICLENSHNNHGGTVVGLEALAALRQAADRHNLPMHLDGARIFNAAVALGVPASAVAAPFDSVQFCLSKGLSAPMGSLLAGSRDFIKEARHYRKMLGGGMRQCGIIAAAGMVALTTMVERLAEDHANARALAVGLNKLPDLTVNLDGVRTNIVRVEMENGLPAARPAQQLAQRLEQEGVRCLAVGPSSLRFVLHRHISAQDVRTALQAVEGIVNAASR